MMNTSQRQRIAAYLFEQLAEPMPPPIYTDDEIDVELDNEMIRDWSEGTDKNFIKQEEVDRFITDVEILLEDLRDEIDENEYMTHFYDAAKRTFDGDKTKIRTWFTWLYLIVFGFPNGPRWGDFVQIHGVENFCERVEVELQNLSFAV